VQRAHLKTAQSGTWRPSAPGDCARTTLRRG
jgi:hypothetical protein